MLVHGCPLQGVFYFMEETPLKTEITALCQERKKTATAHPAAEFFLKRTNLRAAEQQVQLSAVIMDHHLYAICLTHLSMHAQPIIYFFSASSTQMYQHSSYSELVSGCIFLPQPAEQSTAFYTNTQHFTTRGGILFSEFQK
jgi:hypothetical protein